MSRLPLIERKKATTNGGTAITILLPAVKPGSYLHIFDYSLYNQSGESVTVKPGVQTLDGFLVFDQSYTVADGTGFGSYYVHKHIAEGERFGMQVTGAAKASTVTMIVSGELEMCDAPTSAAEPPQ